MKKKGTLKTEYETLDKFDVETKEMITGGGETIVAFQWARLSENQYLVVLPKVFRKQTGDSFAIVSAKRFLRLFNK